MWTSSNYSYWEFWDDDPDLNFWGPQKVTFDGANKLIIVNPGVSSIAIKNDVYSNWKEWVTVRNNSRFLPAVRTTGGDPIVGTTQYIGDVYFLVNGWRLVIDPTQTAVEGVLYSENFDTAYFSDTLAPIYPAKVSSIVQSIAPETNETDIHTALDTYPNKTDWKGLEPTQDTTLNSIKTKVDTLPTLIDIEATTILAKEASISAVDAIVQTLPVLQDIRDEYINVTFGGLEIVDNQLIIKDKVGAIVAIFDLFDRKGNPTMTTVFKREVVQ